MNISTNLISTVLGLKCVELNTRDKADLYYNPNIVSFDVLDSDGNLNFHEINIYELAHKCKEWAFTQNYVLNSNSIGYCDICDTGFLQGFEAETEPESIFKACEWIIDQKEIE